MLIFWRLLAIAHLEESLEVGLEPLPALLDDARRVLKNGKRARRQLETVLQRGVHRHQRLSRHVTPSTSSSGSIRQQRRPGMERDAG